MVDLSKTVEAKSDQLNADDLIGGAKTIKVTKVETSNSADQPVSIYYEGDGGKPWKPCKTVRRLLIGAWGADGSKYVGRMVTVYRDPTVKWAGQEVGGIRVSHISHIDKPLTLSLAQTRGKKTPYTIQPLTGETTQSLAMSDEQFSSVCADGNIAASDGIERYKKWFMEVKASPFTQEQRNIFMDKHTEWKKIAEDII